MALPPKMTPKMAPTINHKMIPNIFQKWFLKGVHISFKSDFWKGCTLVSKVVFETPNPPWHAGFKSDFSKGFALASKVIFERSAPRFRKWLLKSHHLRHHLRHRGKKRNIYIYIEREREIIITCCGTFRSRLLVCFYVFFIAITDNVFVCIDINIAMVIFST